MYTVFQKNISLGNVKTWPIHVQMSSNSRSNVQKVYLYFFFSDIEMLSTGKEDWFTNILNFKLFLHMLLKFKIIWTKLVKLLDN